MISTMQADCYEKHSKNWYIGNSLLRTVQWLVEQSPDVLIEDREYEWFADQYREKILQRDRTRRIIFNGKLMTSSS